MKLFKQKTDSQLMSAVNQFFDVIEYTLKKMAKNSKTVIKLDSKFKLRILLKEMVTGGSYLKMDEAYNDILFNPKTMFTCLLECWKKAGMDLSHTTTADIYKKAGRKSVEPIPTSQINKFLAICDPADEITKLSKYRVYLHKFKADGKLNEGTKSPSSTSRDHL